jgi:hypothetical protein
MSISQNEKRPGFNPLHKKSTPRSISSRVNALSRKQSLSLAQKRQVELVLEVKPDWTNDEVLSFCQKCRYNAEVISQGITNAFEDLLPSQDQTAETWNVIEKKKKKSKAMLRKASNADDSNQDTRREDRPRRGPMRSDRGKEAGSRSKAPASIPESKNLTSSTVESLPVDPEGPKAASVGIVSSSQNRLISVPAPGSSFTSQNRPTYAGLLKRSLQREQIQKLVQPVAVSPEIVQQTEEVIETVSSTLDQVVDPIGESSRPLEVVESVNSIVNESERVETESRDVPLQSKEKAWKDLFWDSNPVILPEHTRSDPVEAAMIQFGNFSVGNGRSTTSTEADTKVYGSAALNALQTQPKIEADPVEIAEATPTPKVEPVPVGSDSPNPLQDEHRQPEQSMQEPEYSAYPTPVPSTGYPMMHSGIPPTSFVPYETHHSTNIRPDGAPGYYDPYMQQHSQHQQRHNRPSRQFSRAGPYNRVNNRSRKGPRSQNGDGNDAENNGNVQQKGSMEKEDNRNRVRRHHQGSLSRTYQPPHHQQQALGYAHAPLPNSSMAYNHATNGMYPYAAHYGVHQFYGQNQGYAAPPGFNRGPYGFQGAAPDSSHYANFDGGRGSYAPPANFAVMQQQDHQQNASEQLYEAKTGFAHGLENGQQHQQQVPPQQQQQASWDGKNPVESDALHEQSFERRADYETSAPVIPNSYTYPNSGGLYAGQMHYPNYAQMQVAQQSYGEPMRSGPSQQYPYGQQWTQQQQQQQQQQQ